MMTQKTPLLEVKSLCRNFGTGDQEVAILKNIDLKIYAGEMIAIMGASGSGKSTLMNILGCLDKPTSGEFWVNGELSSKMSPDELARLRREYFGFIFQRYHLLSDLSAQENITIPAVYSGMDVTERNQRALSLLDRLGLKDKAKNRPNQLSGGQQQRVSIARSLMNGGDVVLADEPTGALDSVSGKEVMGILQSLNQEGHTVILVTHDEEVAKYADRVIRVQDGRIISDTITREQKKPKDIAPVTANPEKHNTVERLYEACKMAIRSILSHRMRSFLTMLGIIIGIASVVTVVALGNGAQKRILDSIGGLGTNTVDVYRGAFGDRKSFTVKTLNIADANVLEKQPFVDGVSPGVSKSITLRYGNVAVNAFLSGVGEQYFHIRGKTLKEGATFSHSAVASLAPEIVIDEQTQKQLFPEEKQVVGKILLINNMPARVIGVLAPDNNAQDNNNLAVWLPYTTAMHRLLGQDYISYISVRLKDHISGVAAEETIKNILIQRHGREDFSIISSDTIRQTIEETSGTMTLLVSMIAIISLVVGGIGVMNIMLVSVTERTGEIGVRMAVGARRNDILQQFLIEAVILCFLGGVGGVLLSLLFGFAFAQMTEEFSLVFSSFSMISAFLCSAFIGVAFGFLPAKNAAKLDPVVALSRE